jgi:hypothetical protein
MPCYFIFAVLVSALLAAPSFVADKSSGDNIVVVHGSGLICRKRSVKDACRPEPNPPDRVPSLRFAASIPAASTTYRLPKRAKGATFSRIAGIGRMSVRHAYFRNAPC